MNNNLRVFEGSIATHDKDPFYGQVVINKKSGLIEKVLEKGKAAFYTEEIEKKYGKNKLIFPGMGDIHIHAREDQTGEQTYKEDYTTAGNAALNGGITFTAAMPNTPQPLTTERDFDWHRARISQISHPVSILNYIGIGNETRPIGGPGEHFYKAFFGKSVGDLTFYDEHELEDTLKYYGGHNVSFHVEYEPIVEMSVDGRNHSERRPIAAINQGLKLLLPMIEKYEINAKLCHWSTGMQSFDMIKEHKENMDKLNLGFNTTIEVSPLHLLFDTSMTDEDKSLWLKIQMNPAIQGPEHRRALIRGLKEGFIDYLATDHAPHTEEEKYIRFKNQAEADFLSRIISEPSNVIAGERMRENHPYVFEAFCSENGTSGAPWLDTYAAVCSLLMNQYEFTPKDIARVTGYNPGEFVNPHLKQQFPLTKFGKGFGKIEKGYCGNLTVLNKSNSNTINRDQLQTKVGWSPLEGMQMPGGLEDVIIRGEVMTGRFMN